MKKDYFSGIVLVLLLLSVAGCGPENDGKDAKGDYNEKKYGPERIEILPLTDFIRLKGEPGKSRLKVYLSFVDSFDCEKKAPGVFRFELYQRVPRSARPKGKRAAIWPDLNLTSAKVNNEHWRDFLRAYEFEFDFAPVPEQEYILLVTCMYPGGKRLSAEFSLKHSMDF